MRSGRRKIICTRSPSVEAWTSPVAMTIGRDAADIIRSDSITATAPACGSVISRITSAYGLSASRTMASPPELTQSQKTWRSSSARNTATRTRSSPSATSTRALMLLIPYRGLGCTKTLPIQSSGMDRFAEDVRRGLSATPKFLLPHYFYDALGSALFGAICELPEYYVTRAETEILARRAPEIAAAFGQPARLVELGSGSARKSRLLIEALLAQQDELEYMPVDVDQSVLESSSRMLLDEFAELTIRAVCADFRDPATALQDLGDGRTVVLFLGSSIGNLDLDAAVAMLALLRKLLAPGDALFLGADLKKAQEILEPAYDDPLGVTACYNLNLLGRINRELGGDFDLSAFAHRALYDEAEGRIEMHLVSRRAQTVRVGGDAFTFAEGESIHTENSYKYDEATLDALAARAGFRIEKRWTDAKGWFADRLMTTA